MIIEFFFPFVCGYELCPLIFPGMLFIHSSGHYLWAVIASGHCVGCWKCSSDCGEGPCLRRAESQSTSWAVRWGCQGSLLLRSLAGLTSGLRSVLPAWTWILQFSRTSLGECVKPQVLPIMRQIRRSWLGNLRASLVAITDKLNFNSGLWCNNPWGTQHLVPGLSWLESRAYSPGIHDFLPHPRGKGTSTLQRC